MRESLFAELIALQSILPTLKSQVSWICEYPKIWLLEANATVTSCDCLNFRKFDMKLDSATMAVSLVGFELRSRHSFWEVTAQSMRKMSKNETGNVVRQQARVLKYWKRYISAVGSTLWPRQFTYLRLRHTKQWASQPSDMITYTIRKHEETNVLVHSSRKLWISRGTAALPCEDRSAKRVDISWSCVIGMIFERTWRPNHVTR